jgi:hypothetical protein
LQTKKPKQYSNTKRRRGKQKRKAKAPIPQAVEPRPKLNKRGLLRIADEDIRETILHMCLEAGEESGVRPEAIAQAIYPEQWQTMLKRIRLMAKQMALAGDLLILRKGQVADPEEAKGLIRLRITPQGVKTLLHDDEEE